MYVGIIHNGLSFTYFVLSVGSGETRGHYQRSPLITSRIITAWFPIVQDTLGSFIPVYMYMYRREKIVTFKVCISPARIFLAEPGKGSQ